MCDRCGNPFVSRQLVVDFDNDKVNSVSLVQEFEDGSILSRRGEPNAAESEQWLNVIKTNSLPESTGAPETVREAHDAEDAEAIDSLREQFEQIEDGSSKEKLVALAALHFGINYEELKQAFKDGLSTSEILANEEKYSASVSNDLATRIEQVRPLAEDIGLDADKMADAVRRGVTEEEFVANLDQYAIQK